MNDLLRMLSGGDLRSDGHADQVAQIVLENPPLFNDLIAGVQTQDDLIRSRTAHALEKISRTDPQLFAPHIDQLVDAASEEALPSARWHYAMIFANLAVFPEQVERFLPVLLQMLEERSVFVRTWAVSSLTIIARLYPQYLERITSAVAALEGDTSIAVRSRVRSAMRCLLDADQALPEGWVKSERLFG